VAALIAPLWRATATRAQKKDGDKARGVQKVVERAARCLTRGTRRLAFMLIAVDVVALGLGIAAMDAVEEVRPGGHAQVGIPALQLSTQPGGEIQVREVEQPAMHHTIVVCQLIDLGIHQLVRLVEAPLSRSAFSKSPCEAWTAIPTRRLPKAA